MISAQDNETLTRVGPGTPMGELLRRYWTPACLSTELPERDGDPLRVRLLGEDLVAFRDTDGRVGLLAEKCPHRGASLFFGRNEERGLRCVYHGWKFDALGDCLELPNEPAFSKFRQRVAAEAYPTHESGGIVWTYMGPRESMTTFRDFGSEHLPAENVLATKLRTSCNWVQSMEGNIDTAHISYLHQFNGIEEIPDDGSDKPGYPSNAMSWKFWRHDRAPRLEIEDTWFGFRYAGLRVTPNGYTHARVTAYVIPYGTIVASIPFSTRLGMFVPIDDENCWRYGFTSQVPSNPRHLGGENLFAVAPFRSSTTWANSGVIERDHTASNDYRIDRSVQRDATYSGVGDFVSQDLMVTESMGPIYDRTREHLGTTDASIAHMRSVLLDAARGLAAGRQPPAVGAEHDYRSIRGVEKILEAGEDWRRLGTEEDPVVKESEASQDEAAQLLDPAPR